MKKLILGRRTTASVVCAAMLAGWMTAGAADDDTKVEVLTQPQSDTDSHPKAESANEAHQIVIEEVDTDAKKQPSKIVAWLGLAVDESSEALSSQLGLKPGEGLTVEFLAADSPAAKADFHKNDVLVELDGQMLVHPMQFRKLIRMHAEGDSVKLVFFRGGKKQTVSVKLGKTTWDEASNKEDMQAFNKLETLGLQLNGLNTQLRGMSRSLSNARLDNVVIDANINRTMDQTRKAIRDAVQRASSASTSTSDADVQLDNLAHDGVNVDNDATVIVHNKRNSSRTVVQSDDSGTYIIEAGAKTHLSAHDKHGKLLFDGDIDTAAARHKVPKEVWEKVGPMYDQIATPEGGGLVSKENKSDE